MSPVCKESLSISFNSFISKFPMSQSGADEHLGKRSAPARSGAFSAPKRASHRENLELSSIHPVSARKKKIDRRYGSLSPSHKSETLSRPVRDVYVPQLKKEAVRPLSIHPARRIERKESGQGEERERESRPRTAERSLISGPSSSSSDGSSKRRACGREK